MKFIIIIPARFFSKRLPGKPLILIKGKPMIYYAIKIAKKTKAKKIIVATDHKDIFNFVKKNNCEVCMTSRKHKSGVERISEVIDFFKISDNTIIVNLQVDEPLLPYNYINKVASNLFNFSQAHCSTLATPIKKIEEINNPNVVKTILNKNKFAIYFSRSCIPYPYYKDKSLLFYLKKNFFLRHIGLYSYYSSFIKEYVTWKKSKIETIEKLEQLRILWNGKNIYTEIVHNANHISLDTKKDLEKIKYMMK